MAITRETAGAHLNLLWPLGIANRMATNSASPVNGPGLTRLASTAGWTLGRKSNGSVYFNRFPLVELTTAQEATVTRVARATFRPCCDNSTFFQDCNHGSALLGLLVLGASQGLTEDELYREALAFNALWFPNIYTYTAVYLKAARGTEWRDVDAREVMSAALSSASGWRTTVAEALRRRGLLHEQSGESCNA